MVEYLIVLMYCVGSRRVQLLGPVLIVIYIHDIDSYVSSKILKFADDAKILGVVSSTDSVMLLRKGLVDIYRWLMLFNTDKYKVLN